MKDFILQKAEQLKKAEISEIQTIEEAETALYELSMVILIAKNTKKRPLYDDVLKNISFLRKFKLGEYTPKQAWLMGRVLVAARAFEDDTTIQSVGFALDHYLNPPNKKNKPELDFYIAWARAYFLIDASSSFYEQKVGLLDITTILLEEEFFKKNQVEKNLFEKNKSSILWMVVMNLYVYATQKDLKRFLKLFQYIENKLHSGLSLKEFICAWCPKEDYQDWLISLLKQSFFHLNLDRPGVSELKQNTAKFMEEISESFSPDKLLALSVLYETRCFLSNKSYGVKPTASLTN